MSYHFEIRNNKRETFKKIHLRGNGDRLAVVVRCGTWSADLWDDSAVTTDHRPATITETAITESAVAKASITITTPVDHFDCLCWMSEDICCLIAWWFSYWGRLAFILSLKEETKNIRSWMASKRDLIRRWNYKLIKRRRISNRLDYDELKSELNF